MCPIGPHRWSIVNQKIKSDPSSCSQPHQHEHLLPIMAGVGLDAFGYTATWRVRTLNLLAGCATALLPFAGLNPLSGAYRAVTPGFRGRRARPGREIDKTCGAGLLAAAKLPPGTVKPQRPETLDTRWNVRCGRTQRQRQGESRVSCTNRSTGRAPRSDHSLGRQNRRSLNPIAFAITLLPDQRPQRERTTRPENHA